MKVKRKIKINKKIFSRIFTVLIMLMIIMNFVSPYMNQSYAEINTKLYNEMVQPQDNVYSAAIQNILNFTMGAVGSALSGIVLLIVGILYLLLLLIFSPIMGNYYMPGIEDIVFNGVPIFDPNFISPATIGTTLVSKEIKDVIKDFYQTGYVVGGAIFVIGAMIIGMKLAVTSIAQEKAYYKEMIVTWLKGIVLLFTVHILITAVFTINEQIVNELYKAADPKSIIFTIPYHPLGGVGKAIETVANWFGVDATGFTQTEVKGFGIGGLILCLILRSFTEGDLIAAITVAALLGQTVSLMVTYFKRVLVCILLACIAPYIVAVDFIRKLI